MNRRAALLKYQEEARKALEAINAVMAHLGAAALELVTDTNKLAITVGAVGRLLLAFWTVGAVECRAGLLLWVLWLLLLACCCWCAVGVLEVRSWKGACRRCVACVQAWKGGA